MMIRNYYSTLMSSIIFVVFQMALTCEAQVASPSVARFEWVPSPVEFNTPAYFYWDIRNVKECYSTTSGSGVPEKKALSGTVGPVSNSVPVAGNSKWYCIDLNGNRYPSDPSKFIEAQRVVEPPLTAPELTRPAGTYNTGLSVAVINKPGVTYRYSLNGSEVNQYAPILDKALPFNSSATLRVRAYRTGFNPSPETIAAYTIVGAPIVQRFEWVPQIVDTYNIQYFYWDIRNVKECYSTTSGTGSPQLKPISGTTGPFLQAVPISVSSKWYCIDFNGNRVPANPTKFLDAPRIVESPLTAPVVTPAAGSYSTSVTVSVSAKPNVTFRYTLNGSEVTGSSPTFDKPLLISTSTNLRVKAYRAGFNPSPEFNGQYNIVAAQVVTPKIEPNGGTFSTPVSVALSTTTASAQTRYTTDGSNVTASSSLYSVPIVVAVNTTVKAKSFKAGMTDSVQSIASFVIRAAAPLISPNGGLHDSAVNVSLTCTTNGAQIRYTTNGTDVTASSTLYTAPFSIGSTSTVKAKSFKTGMAESTQIAANFVIRQSSMQVIYLHTDALGSVIAETDANGNVIKRSEYKPFGEVKDN